MVFRFIVGSDDYICPPVIFVLDIVLKVLIFRVGGVLPSISWHPRRACLKERRDAAVVSTCLTSE